MRQIHSIVRRTDNEDSSAVWDAIEPITLSHHLWPNNDYFPQVQVRSYYSHDHLHVLFRVYEEEPLVRFYQLNDMVCKDSCVEFFFQPTPASDGRYLNFELNAAGTLLLGMGSGIGDLVFLNDFDPAIFSIRSKTGIQESETGEIYWELALRIPFGFLQERFPDFSGAPGTVITGNFYKCGDETKFAHYLSWNEVTSKQPDFHRTSDFGELRFGQ